MGGGGGCSLKKIQTANSADYFGIEMKTVV